MESGAYKMKLAFTLKTRADNSSLERRFGRCPYFLIVDTDSGKRGIMENPALQSQHGAGTQAAQFLVEEGVEAVISGDFGPNAYSVLDAAGVRMYSATEKPVENLLSDFQDGNLRRATPRGGRGRGRRR